MIWKSSGKTIILQDNSGKMRILFVCHGNICRSAMAEFIFKALVKAKGLEHCYEIASAAVSTEEIGNPIYPPAKRCLSQHMRPTCGY